VSDPASGGYIDGNRSVPLEDVGGGQYLAATLIGGDFTFLALVDTEHIDEGAPLDRHCYGAQHEQLGKLPIEFVKRIAIAQRVHRCGRPTKSGRPCQMTVAQPGDTCAWHSTAQQPNNTTTERNSMTTDYDDEKPSLHPVRAELIPYGSWQLAGIGALPPGWVNVRIWSYDNTLGCDLYVVEDCPGVLHLESCVTEVVMQYADPDGSLWNEWGDPYDDNPVLVATDVVDPPHKYREFADPTWQPAFKAGGYLGTCPVDLIRETLSEHGFADAIPRPDGWTSNEDDADEPW
jgi:hypothetical protein